MKIKKFVALVICPVVLTLLLSPVSFASVQTVNSSLSEPVPSFSSGNVDSYHFYWVCQFQDSYIGEYQINVKNFMFDISVTASSGSSVYYKVGDAPNRYYSIICSSSSDFTYSVNVIDIDTGNLIRQMSSSSPSRDGSRFSFRLLVTGSFSGAHLEGSYVLADNVSNINSSVTIVSPFVNWSQQPLQHNTYHSELSEPVADEYNSYFICNDKLYWLSYRANGLYSYTQNVEVSSVVSSESASYGSSGSGSYSGHSGGQTETVTAPYVIVSGSVSNGEVFNGSASSPNFGQIDYVGSSQGNLSFSQNGNISYNSVEVYPVSISNQLLNRLFDVVIYLTDSSGFKVWLVPRSDLGQSLILDASLYCSAFDLTNGEYLSSSFSSYTGSYQYAGFDYPLEEPISDVRCYGCAFYNLNNIPVNLSDVLWQFDLSFVLWREDVLQKLNDIYNVLSEAESITSYQAPDLASKMDDENIINDLSYNSGDVQQDLNDNIDRGIQSLGSDGGQLQSLTSQIIGLGNGKIFSLLIISLSLGILILILGKNKND